MTIRLVDIRFKPIILLLFLVICLLMVDGIYRIENKLVIKTYFRQAPDGLAGTTLYLQKDGTLSTVYYSDITEDTLINGTWKREKDLLILKFDDDTPTETLYDYNDSLIFTNGVTAYYELNFKQSQEEKY